MADIMITVHVSDMTAPTKKYSQGIITYSLKDGGRLENDMFGMKSIPQPSSVSFVMESLGLSKAYGMITEGEYCYYLGGVECSNGLRYDILFTTTSRMAYAKLHHGIESILPSMAEKLIQMFPRDTDSIHGIGLNAETVKKFMSGLFMYTDVDHEAAVEKNGKYIDRFWVYGHYGWLNTLEKDFLRIYKAINTCDVNIYRVPTPYAVVFEPKRDIFGRIKRKKRA